MRRCGSFALIFALASAPGPYARAAVDSTSDNSARTSIETVPTYTNGGNPLWGVSIRDLSATRDRPIFSVSRRPPKPPAVVSAMPPSKPVAKPQESSHPPLVLIGTIIGGSLRIAIFLEEKTMKTVRLAMGEGRDGWILQSVSIGEARLENADRAETLALRPLTQLTVLSDPAPATEDAVHPVRHRKR